MTLRHGENVYSNFETMKRGLPAVVQAPILRLGEEYDIHYVVDDHDSLERVLLFPMLRYSCFTGFIEAASWIRLV